MTDCVAFVKDVWGYLAVGGVVLAVVLGYGVLKLKDFLPVLKTLLSVNQEYPLGTWACLSLNILYLQIRNGW